MVLAGNVNQTIDQLVTDQYLCFSNSVNCFKVKDMDEGVLIAQLIGATLCFIIVLGFLIALLNKYVPLN